MTTLQTLLNDYEQHELEIEKVRAEHVRAETRDKVLAHLMAYAPFDWQEVQHESGFYKTKFRAEVKGVRFEVDYGTRSYSLTSIVGEGRCDSTIDLSSDPTFAYKRLCEDVYCAHENDATKKAEAEKKARPRFQVLDANYERNKIQSLLDDGYQCLGVSASPSPNMGGEAAIYIALYKPE